MVELLHVNMGHYQRYFKYIQCFGSCKWFCHTDIYFSFIFVVVFGIKSGTP
jgi:hypothetical protein